jgi:hypothetical protein
VVGLWHEQTRCDRDSHIEIHLENVAPEGRHNWKSLCFEDLEIELINPASPVGFGEYDYGSIEHYGKYAGSINEEPVLVPKNPVIGCSDIGHSDGLSERDIAGVGSLYD